MVGVYWHQIWSYGQPVGSKELFETAAPSDIRLNKVVFLRSVAGIKSGGLKTPAEAGKLQPVQCPRTCPLDFRVMASPRKKNKETQEDNEQAREQHRSIADPETTRSPSIKAFSADGNGLFSGHVSNNEATSSRRLSPPGTRQWIQIQCSR